jgi:predicted restriction endonuclease
LGVYKCCICGYTRYTEVCHIKDVSSFPSDTLIKEINDIKNLTCMCRNHHWEFDNGFIFREKDGKFLRISEENKTVPVNLSVGEIVRR